jgi:hypothetical protein
MLRSGEQVWERRAHESLERGEVSPEGGSSPRARRSLARGGVQPSSEAEFYQCGAVLLERNGVSPEGGWACLFWWATEAARTVGPCHWAAIVLDAFYCVVSSFVFCCLRKKNGFPPII